MEGLIDLFFSNPIFTMLLLFGIISYFNRLLGGGKEQETSDHHSTNESQTITQSRQPYQQEGRSRDIEVETITFEEQREKQMEQLAGRMNTTVDVEEKLEDIPLYQHRNTDSSILKDEQESQSKKQMKMKKRIHGKLNRDGLVDSVIMAEVLGQPRALSPYKNVLMKRK